MGSDTYRRRRRSRLVLVGAVVVSVASAILSYQGFRDARARFDASVRHLAEVNARDAARRVDERLQGVMAIATGLADFVAAGNREAPALAAALQTACSASLDILDAGVAFVPYVASDDERLFAPACRRTPDGRPGPYRIDESYDYTDPEHAWFHVVGVRGPYWVGPFRSRIHQQQVVRFGIPVYRDGPAGSRKRLLAVVTIALPLSTLDGWLDEIQLGDNGYGFLLAPDATYISHPNQENVESRVSVFDRATESGAEHLLSSLNRFLTDRVAGAVELPDQASGQSYWVAFHPIPSAGWTIGVTAVKVRTAAQSTELRRRLVQTVSIGIFGFVILSALLFGVIGGESRRFWPFVVAVAAAIVAELAFVWWLTLAGSNLDVTGGTLIADKASLSSYLKRSDPAGTIERIPTGILLESIDLSDPENITVSGYVWSRLRAGAAGFDAGWAETSFDLRRTVALPEIKEVYRRATEGGIEIGWFFSAVLRQKSDHSLYPFDWKTIEISMRHAGLGRDKLLVPDLAAYSLLNPVFLPAVAKRLFIPGWSLERSYFTLVSRDDARAGDDRGGSAHLRGLASMLTEGGTAELRLTVVARRSILGPFISTLLPVIVIASLLFALVMGVTSDPRKDTYGFQMSRLIGASAGLLFALLLAQIRLRSQLATSGLVYVEYFYFVMYFVLLLNIANAFMFVSPGGTHHLIRYRDNLGPKLVYWPLVLGLWLAITLVFFY